MLNKFIYQQCDYCPTWTRPGGAEGNADYIKHVIENHLAEAAGHVSTAVFDDDGNFEAHSPRACGEHRTVGSHRSYCHDCSEWCYPHDGCIRCRYPEG